MHPATPLIPAIWSSSKHAGDVKIPHLDVGEQQAPQSKWMGWGEWRRVENGGVWQGVSKEEGGQAMGGWHKVVGVGWAVACVIHTSWRHRYWLISLTISCDHRYIKHEGGGAAACLYTLSSSLPFDTPSLLWGNVNSFSNLFTSPLVATALCFWWRAAKIVSFFYPCFSPFWQTQRGHETLHLQSHPGSLAVI